MPRAPRQFARTVAKNSAYGMASQLGIKVLSFGFSVLIVRHLGAGAYGQYAAVLAFGAVFVFLADLGLSPYTVREVARLRDKPDGLEQIDVLYGDVLLLRLLLSVVATMLMVLTAWLTGRPLVMVVAIALGAVGLMLYGAQGASSAVLSGFERLDLTAGTRVLNQLVFVLVGALALWLGAGYFGLIGANLLGIALMTYACWQAVRHLGARPGKALIRRWPQLLAASLPFGLISFALGFSYNFDSILLNIFRGDAVTGYYNAAYGLIFSAVVLSNVLNSALYPSLARQAAVAPQVLPSLYERALRYLLMLALPLTVGIWALAGQLVPALYTGAYLPAVPVLRLLIWAAPLMFVSEFLGYVVVIRGEERRVARAVLVSSAINVALNLLLVPRFGLMGAATMTVVTEVVLVGQYVWLLRDLLRQIDWGLVFWRPLLAALVMGCVVLALRTVALPLVITLGGLTYGLLLLGLGALGREEWSFLRSLRQPGEAALVAEQATPQA